MLLVEKKRIVEQQLDASVLIAALAEDKDQATMLMTEFNIVGLSYVFLEKTPAVRNDYWYWRASEESMKRASCLVIIMSRALFDEENAAQRESFWYEAGVMEAHGKKVIPFMLDIPRSDWDQYLSKTPIRQTQATGDVNDLITHIEQAHVIKKNFFADRDIAYYGNSRIYYAEMSIILNIRREAVDSILKRLRLLDDDEIQTRMDVLQLLQKEVSFGVQLYRFGRECFIEHPHYSAYAKESEVLNKDFNTIGYDNRFTLLSQNVNNPSYAVKVEFIIPVHEIFGTAIKPYMEINKNSVIKKTDLLNVLRHEAGEEIFRDKLDAVTESCGKTEKIYFNLYFDDDNMLIECNDEKIGRTCNYFYAK